jgi:hypothetical protein
MPLSVACVPGALSARSPLLAWPPVVGARYTARTVTVESPEPVPMYAVTGLGTVGLR